MPDQPIENDTTRATARLPGLDIEIVHRRSPSADFEQVSINLQAAPSFEAFGRFLEAANPLAFWAKAAQMAWLPWLGAARMLTPTREPANEHPQLDGPGEQEPTSR